MTEQVQAVRAGFWRRALALLVDCIVIAILLQVLGLVGFQLSNGRVQFGGGVKFQECVTLTAPPPGMEKPSFEPNYMNRCQASIFGWPTARTATVGRKTQDGAIVTDIKVTTAVDADGRAVSTFFLEWLFIPLLIVLRWWQDRDDASPGRHAVNIHIARASTGERPAAGMAKRYALFALIFLPAYVVEAWWTVFGDLQNVEIDLAIAATASTLTFLVVLIAVVIPIIRKRDTFYDRLAGTAVILDKQPKAKSTDVSPASAAPR